MQINAFQRGDMCLHPRGCNARTVANFSSFHRFVIYVLLWCENMHEKVSNKMHTPLIIPTLFISRCVISQEFVSGSV